MNQLKYDPLIYGKNQIERIVSVEAQDGSLELFIESPTGEVETQIISNRFWILSPKKLGTDWIKLNGSQYYQYGKQYVHRDEFEEARRLLRKYDIYSVYNPIESSLINTGITYFKGMKHDEVSILSFDIESTSLEHNASAKILLISNTIRKNGIVERKLFDFKEYKDEGEMLEDWCAWVREQNPSIICGHNIYMYDLPYMQFIADRYGVSLNLGRDGSSIQFQTFESKFRKDGSQFYHYKKCRIYGREIIDTMFLAIKYDVGRKYESYGLKAIIKHEGLEVKNRQFYDAGEIRLKYNDPVEWEKIRRYAIHDADDSLALYDLMSPPIFYFTQSIPKSYQAMVESATGSQLNALLVRSYLQNKHSIPKANEPFQFEGAISLGIPGIYKNATKFDVSSLYPSVIIEYSVFDRNKDPNGYFLKMVDVFRTERLRNKKLANETGDKYYRDMEQTQKIGINSAYGMLGAPGLNFNYPKGAAFITRKGREILVKSIEWATGKSYDYWKTLNLDDKEEVNE